MPAGSAILSFRPTRARGLGLCLWAVLACLVLAGCGGKADRRPREGGGETAPVPTVPPVEPKVVEPAGEVRPQVQVVYYATDRARATLDLDWYLDRYTFPLVVLGLGVLLLFALFRMVRARYRGRMRIVAWTFALGVLALFAQTTWDVVQKQTLANRVGGIVYGHDRGTYGGGDELPLELGRLEVSVPVDHVEGELERPSPFEGDLFEDPREHWVMLAAEVLPEGTFFREVRERAAGGRDVLVFVHGYNCTFEEAAYRAAQVAWDLDFSGPPILYSWPSAGQLEDYHRDSESVKWTRRHLQRFLTRLASETRGARIHLIAHSMGNRALTEALIRMRLDAGGAPTADDPFHQIVLAAPDIDADTFREDIAPAIRSDTRRITLFASRNDWALRESERFNGAPRAGQADPDSLVLVAGVDTVDVTPVTGDHSYIGTSGFVLGCMRALLAGAPRPLVVDDEDGRGLREVKRRLRDSWYWVLERVDGSR